MIELAVIINSFNRVDLLRMGMPALINALKALSCKSSIMIFDAGSTDGTLEYIKSQANDNKDLRITTITAGNNEDSSFSAGINRACEAVIECEPKVKWLFLYETDNWLAGPEPLVAAIKVMENELKLGAIGFTVRKHNGEAAGYGCPFPSFTQFILGPQLMHFLKLDQPFHGGEKRVSGYCWWPCDVVYTSPILVRREAWEQSGGLDTQEFPFAETDVDWCWRVAKKGWTFGVLQTKDVVHDNLQKLSAWSANRAIKYHRARLLLLKRHRSAPIMLCKSLLWLRHLLEVMVAAILWCLNVVSGENVRKRWLLLRTVWRDYEGIDNSIRCL